MASTPRFAQGYERPELGAVTTQTRTLAERLTQAGSATQALAVIREWNRLRSALDTNQARAYVRYCQDTTCAGAKAEQDFWNEAAPTLRELDVIHARALTASSHAEAINREFGPQLLRLKECAAATYAPEIRESLAEEARLTTRYVELISTKALALDGRRYTTAGIRRFFGVADRRLRLGAYQAQERFLSSHADTLDQIFDRLVLLRDQMGRSLGWESYIPLGYQLRTRIGYAEHEVSRFREGIRTEIVPLCQVLRARQAQRLGVETLLLHDEAVWDPAGNPEPFGDPPAILNTAREMYHELHPDLGAFMDTMLDNGMLDVQLRDGKAPCGFCVFLPDLGLPFVFGQFVGTEYDLHLLIHECGHAFQDYSARSHPLIEYIGPTGEAAEVHSMALELLTYPWMDRFFGDAAERYRRGHLERALCVLPYVTLLDHFQHEVYRRPSLPPSARNALWRSLEREYLPWRDYDDCFPHFAKGGVWQLIWHLFLWPFRGIDYALAQSCALQIHQRSLQDPRRALADYLAICKVGGSVSFQEMLEVGSLTSPFDSDCLRSVAQHARQVLGL
jgi:M3 family oligoendopeptidase